MSLENLPHVSPGTPITMQQVAFAPQCSGASASPWFIETHLLFDSLSMQKHLLTAAEKYQLVRLHRKLKAELAQGLRRPGRTLRQLIKKITGYAYSTIWFVLAHWNKHHDPLFMSTFGARGHCRHTAAEHYGSEIRKIILDRNLNQDPTNAAHVVTGLQNLADFTVPLRTMRRVVKRLGFSYAVGQKRNIAADAAGTVKFREGYLLKKVVNRDHHRNPLRPEVFLDESYVNEHHVASRSWLPADRISYAKSGKGCSFCIVGAGVLYRKNGGLHDTWVKDSLNDKFEDWFEKLCCTLQRDYGECNIAMDGASYHRRIIKPAPKKGWKKKRILRWLLEHGIPWGTDTRNALLLRLAAVAKPKTNYAANIIAREYGHRLFYTPPYNPELQPIEMVWGAVKNRIAVAPAKSMADLGVKLGASLNKVTSHRWRGAYRKVQKKENEYIVKVREDQEKRRAIEAEAQAEAKAAAEKVPVEDYIFQC
ncbi:unnamed protein product [Phytophthora fragariaefolia]|uniref:Unnamed protein product n=1 Tax=Phytophthora fragariaefolia TaxID=1490495 RepID=A0A9W6Y3X9_9STRA|nr:unnamed protein product [Phytophthora fragariaefolia]